MKFSVLVPIYNAEKYIEQCIECIFSQNYPDVEIILVNDGSTDKSAELCNRYQNKHPDVIKVIHKQNQGQLSARCDAIKSASGEYCIFMDVDDLLVENALLELRNNLEKFNLPDMLIYSFFYEDESGKQRLANSLFEDEKVFDLSNKKELLGVFFTGTGLNNVWTKAVKCSKIIDLNFDFDKFFSLRCSEDKLHSMVMLDACEQIVYRHLPLYRYKLVSGSVTRHYDIASIERFNTVSLYDVELDFLRKWNFDLIEWKLRLDAQYVSSAYYIFDLFYNNVNFDEKNKVLKYDWASFLCEETLNNIQNNPYLNETQKKLWFWIKNRNYGALRFHFLKKRIRKTIKKFKG